MKPTEILARPMQAATHKHPSQLNWLNLEGTNWWPKVRPHAHYSIGPVFALSCLGLGVVAVQYSINDKVKKASAPGPAATNIEDDEETYEFVRAVLQDD